MPPVKVSTHAFLSSKNKNFGHQKNWFEYRSNARFDECSKHVPPWKENSIESVVFILSITRTLENFLGSIFKQLDPGIFDRTGLSQNRYRPSKPLRLLLAGLFWLAWCLFRFCELHLLNSMMNVWFHQRIIRWDYSHGDLSRDQTLRSLRSIIYAIKNFAISKYI